MRKIVLLVACLGLFFAAGTALGAPTYLDGTSPVLAGSPRGRSIWGRTSQAISWARCQRATGPPWTEGESTFLM